MRRLLLVALVLVLAACSAASARVEPDVAVMNAPQLDDLSLLQTDAQSQKHNTMEGQAGGDDEEEKLDAKRGAQNG